MGKTKHNPGYRRAPGCGRGREVRACRWPWWRDQHRKSRAPALPAPVSLSPQLLLGVTRNTGEATSAMQGVPWDSRGAGLEPCPPRRPSRSALRELGPRDLRGALQRRVPPRPTGQAGRLVAGSGVCFSWPLAYRGPTFSTVSTDDFYKEEKDTGGSLVPVANVLAAPCAHGLWKQPRLPQSQ